MMSLLSELMYDNWNIHMNCHKKQESSEVELEADGKKEIDKLPFPLHFNAEGSSFEQLVGKTNSDLLSKMVNDGWNLQIEGKGHYREYGMTFEASATKQMKDLGILVQYHAVADEFPLLLEEIRIQEVNAKNHLTEF